MIQSIAKHTVTLIFLLPLLVAAGCGGESPGVVDPGGTGGGDPIPNPNGVLLDGAPTTAARNATVVLPPSPVAPIDIADGLLTTRLDAAIAPSATVGEVNAALDANGARIVTMRPGMLFVTLKIPAVENAGEAELVAGALVSTGAFVYATPARPATSEAVRSSSVQAGLQRVYPDGGSAEISHLEAMNFHSAWNVAQLAINNDNKVTVIVPDEYVSVLPHAEIDAQSIEGWGGPSTLPGEVMYPGNHGFAVSGIIGANFDATPITGTSPDPNELLDIVSLPIAGLSWNDITWLLGYKLLGNSTPFVVNTSIGWNDPSFAVYSKLDRAMQVIAWRIVAALHYDKFVHVASAGSEGAGSELNSVFTAAHYYDDVRDFIDFNEVSTADSIAIETMWFDLTQNFTPATAIQHNVIVVGSSDANGALSAFSNFPYHVRALGEGVAGPCAQVDPGFGADATFCDGEVAHYSGTSLAAPQIAGLAAYLMNLDPGLSASSVRQKIIDFYDESIGTVRAFDAALSIDNGLNDAPVRTALLDLVSIPPATGTNGQFDEYDIMEMAKHLWPGEHSRYDLIGSGRSGYASTTTFDLNADGLISIVTPPQAPTTNPFDESNVSAFTMLCYYAYTPIYKGTPDGREQALDDALGFGCPSISLEASGEWESDTDYDTDRQSTQAHLFPATLETDISGAGNIAKVTVKALGKSGSISAHGFATGLGGEGTAEGEVDVSDRITIFADGLEGTQGTCMLNVAVTGTMNQSGDCDGGDARVAWFLSAGDFTFCRDINNCGTPSSAACDAELPDTFQVPLTFTYGSPVGIGVGFSAEVDSEVDDVDFGNYNSTVQVEFVWMGITGLPAGATVVSCSGLDWLTAGP